MIDLFSKTFWFDRLLCKDIFPPVGLPDIPSEINCLPSGRKYDIITSETEGYTWQDSYGSE